MQKVAKKSSPARCAAGRAGQRTWTLRAFEITFRYWSDRTGLLLRAIWGIERRCVFRLQSLQLLFF